MRRFTLRDFGHRFGHARCRTVLAHCSTRDMGAEGHAGCVCLCQGEEQLGWPKHVVSIFPSPASAVAKHELRKSLIYQLLDYERSLKGGDHSPATSDRSSVAAAEEEEWARRRQMVEDADSEDNDRESIDEVMREAHALDKAMEYRRVARKSSASSLSSNGIGMGLAWREKYGSIRKRTGSVASTGSFLSENLLEEEEEHDLLGAGGGFTETSCSSAETEDESPFTATSAGAKSPDLETALADTPKARHRPHYMPPSAPAHRPTFELPPVPATATRASFDLTPKSRSKVSKPRKRPPPLVGLLPPVPSSPITPVQDERPIAPRARTEGRKPDLPPAYLRNTPKLFPRKPCPSIPVSATPSQTLFVFPPSPTITSRTPSTMTLLSNTSLPFPTSVTPRVATFKFEGRRRSFIGVGAPVTPTIAASRVDARGWIGGNNKRP